jgi:hypothetical protein
MNRAIFDQARDAGLRVTNLILRQNPEPDGLGVQSGEQTRIDLEDVARALEHLIDPNFVNVPAEQVLFPRCSAASEQALPEVALPLDPYREVILPPQAYCPPEQPKIPTQEKIEVERTIPYSDEEMEARIAAAIENFETKPEPRQKKDRNPPRQQQDSESSGKSKRRRGRRRGGRGKSREQKAEETEVTKPTGKAGAKKDNSKPENKAVAKPSPEAPVEEKPKKTVKKAAKKAAKKQAPAKKAAKKKAAKKAAKKAVKKAAK